MPKGDRRFPAKYWSDELHRQAQLDRSRRKARKRWPDRKPATDPMDGSAWRTGNFVRTPEPPADVLADAERVRLYEPDITALVMGDPAPWRSALGKKQTGVN